MGKFIELNRQFGAFDPSQATERSSGSFRPYWYGGQAFTWQAILQNRCTVVIAEAGVGKSEEMRHQARKLQAEGHSAFFCPIEQLVTMPLSTAIGPDQAANLRTWQSGTEHGYFFLDSVDEARLSQPSDFERAIAAFVETVAAQRDRITVVISTRPHAWQAYADREMLAWRLGLAPVETTTVPRQEDAEDGDDTQSMADSASRSKTVITPAIEVVRLLPLTEKQVRQFAQCNGVGDVDAFIAAIERADADEFAVRPADLPALIDTWNRTKKIGRYSQVVAGSITLKLRELNVPHEKAAEIGLDRLMQGARLLAAAVTLTQRTAILLPDQDIDPALRAASIDPNLVLTDWSSSEIDSLLGRALFDASLYGTVRFHHRTAREYLAAQWFEDLLKKQKSRRAVEGLFFVRPYGTEGWVVAPRMKAIVGWLAGVDQRIRDRVMGIDAKVLLEYGDASALDIGTREALLRKFAARYEKQSHTPISLDIREVRRLANQALSGTIGHMLNAYRHHYDVRNLLLRIVREGPVAGCGSVTSSIVKDAACGPTGRSYAVEAVGTAGTDKERAAAAAFVVANAAKIDEDVVSTAIRSFWPDVMSDADLVRILTDAITPKDFSVGALSYEVGELAQRVPAGAPLEALHNEVLKLVLQPPLHADTYCRISVRYAWLVPFLWKLTKRLLSEQPSPGAASPVVAAVAVCNEADHLQRYVGEVHREAVELITTDKSLRHAVFWYEITRARAASKEPVTTLWGARVSSVALYSYDENDLEAFLDAVQHRPNLDDRHVALSVLQIIGRDSTRNERVGKLVQESIKDDAALSEAWVRLNTPHTPTATELETAEFFKKNEREHKARQRRTKAARNDWIAKLQAHPEQVGDLTIVPEGKVMNYTTWLHNELRELNKEQSNTSWTVANWRMLEPEFGLAVAEAFRDFCKAAWRLYQPRLRSEREDTTGTPWTVILGLSGLAMEAADGDWVRKLTADEAKNATRYALHELNRFPSWLNAVHEAHRAAVEEVLAQEIGWELSREAPDDAPSYLLGRLVWTAKKLAGRIADTIADLLLKHPEANGDTLISVLSIVLRNKKIIPEPLLKMAQELARKSNDDKRASIWHAFRLCVDAKRAMPDLHRWVASSADAQTAETRISRVLNLVWGDRDQKFGGLHQDYNTSSILQSLIELSHAHVQMQHDLEHDDVYSPGMRDHAQRARNHLTELLRQIPGRETYDALKRLATTHTQPFLKDRMLVLAEARAEADAEEEMVMWTEQGVVQFATEAEHPPATQRELYQLALSRLDDLKIDYEDGDESIASLLRKAKDEVELRRTLAHALRQTAQGQYTTGSEEELADVTRTDIRFHNPNVDERIPIELKIAGQWLAPKHLERLENQLIRQYMREARYGIFLVVNRGAAKDTKSWVVAGKRVPFKGLVGWLGSQADRLAKKHAAKVSGLTVVGIDLTEREALAKATRKKRASQVSRNRKRAGAKTKKSTRSTFRRATKVDLAVRRRKKS